MSECRRNYSREEMIHGLFQGRTLCVDRRDAPELDDLLEWERQGLVTSELTVLDEQSSVLKFKATPKLMNQQIPKDLT